MTIAISDFPLTWMHLGDFLPFTFFNTVTVIMFSFGLLLVPIYIYIYIYIRCE